MSEGLTINPEVMPASGIKRRTGPRTERGKQRSRYNALKCGVFSDVVLLPGESRARYQWLLAEFEEYFRPVGLPEQACVEELVNLVWRRRRLLTAERSEIERAQEITLLPTTSGGTIFEERLRVIEQRTKARNSNATREVVPPLPPIRKPTAQAVRLLNELSSKIKERGLDPDKDSAALVEIYGFDPLKSPATGLFEVIKVLAKMGEHPDLVVLTVELLNELESELVKAEFQHCKELERSAKEAERRRADRQKTASRMLPPERMELFLRYEAGLNREFDRILRRLEVLQRMRRGQPAPPEVTLNVST